MSASSTNASPARRWIASLIALVAIAASAVAWAKWDAWMVIPKKRTAALNALRDPASAQFSDEKVAASGYVCGRLNAKNGMGGYTGFQRYASTEIDFLMEDSTGPTVRAREVTTAEIMEGLDWKIQFMKTKSRQPTAQEEQQAAFDRRWAKVCG